MSSHIASLRECLKITFPPVMFQLLEEAIKPTPDFTLLAKILGMDPILTAAVLNLANSPYYGSVHKVTDLNRAATILGTKEILKIALSIVYQRHLNEAFNKRGLDFYANWRLIIWSAIASELLAERLCPEFSHQAYLAALLKDVSLLMLACCDLQTKECFPNWPLLTDCAPGQLEMERRQLGTDHCQLTIQLLEQWRVPVPKMECLEHHHDFENFESHDNFTQCLILAARWSELEHGAQNAPSAVVHFRALLRRRLDLEEDQLEELADRVRGRFQSMLATLGIAEAPPDSRYYQHNLRLMKQYHFMASELDEVEGGKDDAARIIARHLKWEWGLEEWELALGVPEYRYWNLYSCCLDKAVAKMGTADNRESLSWTLPQAEAFVMSAGETVLGELRFPRKAVTAEVRRQIELYLRFLSKNYQRYAMAQMVLELKAHTLDELPVGVARLSPDGRILEINDRLRQFLEIQDEPRGKDIWELLDEGRGFSRDAQWDRFLAESGHASMHKIFCLWHTGTTRSDTCVYLAAEKRRWHDREEILLFLEDVSLVSGWEFKALKQGEFLEKLIHSMREAVMTVDAAGRITYASPRVVNFLDKNLFELAKPAPTYQGLWGPDILAATPEPVEVLLPQGQNRTLTLELVFSALPKQPGQTKQWLVVGRDITAVRRLEEKLKRLAMFDGLTGLLNHYQFHVILEREVHRAQRTGRGMGLVFFDLDNFKQINDTQGHQAGDNVLRTVSRILSEGMRKGMDYPCRYGGDEFAVVVSEVEAEQLHALASRMNERVQAQFKGALGLSVGLAMLGPKETPAALLRRADKASYQAKSQGGHRILWAQE